MFVFIVRIIFVRDVRVIIRGILFYHTVGNTYIHICSVPIVDECGIMRQFFFTGEIMSKILFELMQ